MINYAGKCLWDFFLGDENTVSLCLHLPIQGGEKEAFWYLFESHCGNANTAGCFGDCCSLCFHSIVWNCSMELTACDMQNRRTVWSHRIALLFLRPLCPTEPWVLPVPKPVSPTLVCLPSYLVTFCWFLMQYSEFSNFLKFVPSRNAIRCPVSPENENRFYLDVCIEIGI